MPERAADHRPAVVRRVRPHQHPPGHAVGPGGPESSGDQPAGPGRGGGVAAPQPGGGDHRRSGRGAQRVELGVQPPHSAVTVGDALLGVAVHLTHSVIDVQERDPTGAAAGQQARDLAGEPAISRPPTASSCCTCPWVDARRNVPSVEAPGPHRTVGAPRRAAAPRGPRSSSRRTASRRRARSPSPPHLGCRPSTCQPHGHAGRRTEPAAATAPTRPPTPGSGHRESAGRCAMPSPTRCPLLDRESPCGDFDHRRSAVTFACAYAARTADASGNQD